MNIIPNRNIPPVIPRKVSYFVYFLIFFFSIFSTIGLAVTFNILFSFLK